MAGAGLLLLMVGVLQKNDRSMGALSFLAILAMAGAAYFVVMLPAPARARSAAPSSADGFARFSKLLILLGAALTHRDGARIFRAREDRALRISRAVIFCRRSACC